MDKLSSVLINGQPSELISVTDRGLAYGDGLFETISVVDGHLCLWEKHCQRLLAGCRALKIPFDNVSLLKNEAQQLIKPSTKHAVIKIIITRGLGAQGYQLSPLLEVVRIIQLQERQTVSEEFYSQGVKARFCQQRLADNPRLAGIKHLCRLEQVLARMEWQDEYHEGIMLDYQSNVIEGTMSNLFIIRGNSLQTPLIDHCGVQGVMRGWIIDQCKAQGIGIEETLLEKSDLLEADGIFFCNAVIRVWPVRQLDEHHYNLSKVHNVLKSLPLLEKL